MSTPPLLISTPLRSTPTGEFVAAHGSPTPLKSEARVAEGMERGAGVGGVPSRPLLRYHGGKWVLGSWIIANFPAHRVYAEPFGGAASVLLQKPRVYAEIYNDLDGEIVSLFRVVRDRGAELLRALELTPFARAEFVEAWKHTDEPLESARRTIIRSFMGFSTVGATKRGMTGDVSSLTGFRTKSKNSYTTPYNDWRRFPANLGALIERMQGVCIECKPAAEVMATHDGVDTLHYVDPPYVAGTRDAGGDYRHEMTDADHRALAEALHGLRGMVCLSGYPCALYEELYGDWRRIERAALADGARKRVEVLWMNYSAPDADLFGPLGGGGRGESVAFATERKSGND